MFQVFLSGTLERCLWIKQNWQCVH